MRPFGHRDGFSALSWLPHHLSGLVLHPFAFGPLLAPVTSLFLGQLRLALDVDAPTGEASGQSGVLPFLADRKRQLIIADDHRGRAGLVVKTHLPHAGRSQGGLDEFDGIIGKGHHIHALTA